MAGHGLRPAASVMLAVCHDMESRMRTQTLAAEWAPRLLSVLRIVAALIFLEHGTQKIFGFPMRMGGATSGPAFFTMYWFAGWIEIVGGIMLLLGLFTRPVALILSGQMAFAYFIGHAPRNFFPVLNGGDAAILYCFVFLYMSAAGGGPWSLDAARGDRGRGSLLSRDAAVR
jgi:putative oxidoreductase